MKRKPTNWDRHFKQQTEDPVTRKLVEEELKALRVGVQLAKLREKKGLTQGELAAKAGMSAPNVSRIETNPSQNMTLRTMLKLFEALDCDVTITPRQSRRPRSGLRRTKAGKGW
jgi:HTH-type transcriptional regulator / antitoxin HipB